MLKSIHSRLVLVIVLRVFFIKNCASAVALPSFSCDNLGGRCTGTGDYVCSERPQVDVCDTRGASEPARLEKTVCRMECHFNSACGSYEWDASTGMCVFCSVDTEAELKLTAFRVPLEIGGSGPVVVQYGVHHGELTQFTVAKVDYISRGYITPRAVKFKQENTLVHGNTDEIEVRIRGVFCFLHPYVAQKKTSVKKADASRILLFVLILVVPTLLCFIYFAWPCPFRRRWLFLKHRARLLCSV